MSLSYQVKPKPKPNSKLWLVRFDPRPVKTSTCVCKKTKHTSDINEAWKDWDKTSTRAQIRRHEKCATYTGEPRSKTQVHAFRALTLSANTRITVRTPPTRFPPHPEETDLSKSPNQSLSTPCAMLPAAMRCLRISTEYKTDSSHERPDRAHAYIYTHTHTHTYNLASDPQ